MEDNSQESVIQETTTKFSDEELPGSGQAAIMQSTDTRKNEELLEVPLLASKDILTVAPTEEITAEDTNQQECFQSSKAETQEHTSTKQDAEVTLPDVTEATSSSNQFQKDLDKTQDNPIKSATIKELPVRAIDGNEDFDQDTPMQANLNANKADVNFSVEDKRINSDVIESLHALGHECPTKSSEQNEETNAPIEQVPSPANVHLTGSVEEPTEIMETTCSIDNENTDVIQEDLTSCFDERNVDSIVPEDKPIESCLNEEAKRADLEVASKQPGQVSQVPANDSSAGGESVTIHGDFQNSPCNSQAAVEEKNDASMDMTDNQIPSIPAVSSSESLSTALINEDTSSQDFVKSLATPITKSPIVHLDTTTDASGRSTPDVDSLLKDSTGRDSPSIRSLKDESGRDSPSRRSRRKITRDSVVTEANELNRGIFPAENLFEYQWPQEKGAEWYFVQEQISEFLQVKSFKRKYPELERRVMDIQEKDFLRERGVVTEEQVTLGLTALRADDVYDLMLKDAPEKSAEYARVLHEKEKQNISNKHKQYEVPSVDSSKVKEYVKKAVKQAADYNAALMAERREERRFYFDMQTLTVQMPASRMKKYNKESTKLGPYPVAVIPGQYQNYYRSYSPEELKYFPLNTSLYGPMAPRRQTDIAPPQSKDEIDRFSDNDTVMSNENIDSLSDTSEQEQPASMDVGPDNVELIDQDDMSQGNITLPPDPTSGGYKSVAVRELEPCAVVGLERPKDIPDAICGLCLKDSSQNKMGMPEKMIHCSQCDNSGHPSCLDMTPSMVEVIQTYPWQCMECKTCFHCGDPTHEDKMMFCDVCDRGYHTFCVGLQDIPTGLWACESCQTSHTPAALAPHVPTPPLPPTPPPAEPNPIDHPTPPPSLHESTPTSKKRSKKPASPMSASKQSTPGSKRTKSSTPTPKRVKKK